MTTPGRAVEFLVGTAAALFMPPVGVACLRFGVFVAITQFAARSAVSTAVVHAPQLPAELVFIPLLAGWSIWVGLAISARATDTRVSQQLGTLASLPPVAVAALFSFQVISPTFAVAAAFAGGLLVIDGLACFAVARVFDRERLITGTKSTSGSYRTRGA